MTTVAAYKFLGITDEVTTCDCCGRVDLKATTVLERAEDGVIVHFGSQCGARALGWKVKDFNAAGKTAQAERKRAIDAAVRDHPASVLRNQLIKAHYDAGGSFATADTARWRALDAQAIEDVRQQFNASTAELRPALAI